MQNNAEEQKDLGTLVDQIKKDLSSYLNNRLERFKLKSYEKISISGSFIVYGLIIFFLLFNIFFLVLLSLGFLIGEWLNSPAAGFAILIGISLIILVICLFNGKRIRRYFTNLVVSIIRKVETDEEKTFTN
ncbi:MAG: phage holin family protein [Dysgonomonas sp.]